MITTGNIKDINKNYKEWFLGNFVNEKEFNTTNCKNFEAKWSIKVKGEKFPLKERVVEDSTCKSLVILLKGKFKYSFLNLDGTFSDKVLNEEGDFVYWTPDINHTIEALGDSTTITIRWYS